MVGFNCTVFMVSMNENTIILSYIAAVVVLLLLLILFSENSTNK